MTSIQGGQPQFNAPLVQQQAGVKAGAPATAKTTQAANTVPNQPTGTSISSQKVGQLTSEQAKLQLHTLIKTQPPNLSQEMPKLNLLQRQSVSANLAHLLEGHHPEQQQGQQQAQSNNPHAAAAAGSLQSAAHFKTKQKGETEDSAWQNTAQSGRKSKKDDDEGEFSSLDDFGGGAFSGGSQDDSRSGSQKKKELLRPKDKPKSLKKDLKVPLRGGIKPPKGLKKKGFF